MPEMEFLSTRQAALRLGVSLGTVQNMVENGSLDAWKTAGGHRRIPVSSVDAMLTRRKGAINASAMAAEQLGILIAEGDPALQALYKTTFERWNLPLRLHVVDNGFDALLQINQYKPDVLITSLLLRGVDGAEMIRHLCASPDFASMDMIVITPDDAGETARDGLPAKITVFGKPVPFHELKGFMLGRLAARLRPEG